MARYNEIQVGRYNRALQKLLSMKGVASLESLQPELIAVLNTFYGAENRYLEAWDQFGSAVYITGVAGNQTAMRIRNPSGSNVLAVVIKASVFSISASSRMNLTKSATLSVSTDLTNLSAQIGLDARGRKTPTCSTSSEALAGTTALANSISETQMTINQAGYDFILNENQELPLLPGDALQLTAVTTGAGGAFSYWWRERFLEDSERS